MGKIYLKILCIIGKNSKICLYHIRPGTSLSHCLNTNIVDLSSGMGFPILMNLTSRVPFLELVCGRPILRMDIALLLNQACGQFFLHTIFLFLLFLPI